MGGHFHRAQRLTRQYRWTMPIECVGRYCRRGLFLLLIDYSWVLGCVGEARPRSDPAVWCMGKQRATSIRELLWATASNGTHRRGPCIWEAISILPGCYQPRRLAGRWLHRHSQANLFFTLENNSHSRRDFTGWSSHLKQFFLSTSTFGQILTQRASQLVLKKIAICRKRSNLTVSLYVYFPLYPKAMRVFCTWKRRGFVCSCLPHILRICVCLGGHFPPEDWAGPFRDQGRAINQLMDPNTSMVKPFSS